jgi:hypothetical protein
MELTRTFSARQYENGLESWSWLDLAGKVPIFTSPFGDVFFRSDDGFWWLDALEGQLSKQWDRAEDLHSALATPDGQDHYLLAGLALGAERRGMFLAEDQVYSFTVPPALGGATDLSNVQVMTFTVSLNISGQLHNQIRDLPPGTQITGITIAD